MNDSVNPTTAKAKLALSRTALLGAMGYERAKEAVEDTQMSGTVRAIHTPARPSALRSRISQSVLGRWWQRHPMSSVVELGQPFLQHYAQRNPGKLIAYGAGTGALLWIIKPWKLLSLATVLTLIVKSSDVSGMFSDLMRNAGPVESGNAPAASPSHFSSTRRMD